MKIQHLLLTAGCLLFTYSFAMPCDNFKKQMKEIIGSWELQKTDCCGRLNKTTQAQPGEKSITFYPDGKMDLISSGEKTASTFNLYTDTNFDQEAPLLNMGKEGRPAMYKVKGDTLTISWGYMDLQTEYYLRKK